MTAFTAHMGAVFTNCTQMIPLEPLPHDRNEPDRQLIALRLCGVSASSQDIKEQLKGQMPMRDADLASCSSEAGCKEPKGSMSIQSLQHHQPAEWSGRSGRWFFAGQDVHDPACSGRESACSNLTAALEQPPQAACELVRVSALNPAGHHTMFTLACSHGS